MPRNRIISRIDDELVIAKESLAFWRDQTFLADIHCATALVQLSDCARRKSPA